MKWRKTLVAAGMLAVLLLCRPLFNRGVGDMNAGKLAYDRGNYAQARDDFRRAIELKSTGNRHVYLALAYWKLGELDDAQREGRIGIQLDPESATAHENLSLIYVSAKKFEDATQEAKAATRLGPNNINTWYALISATTSNSDFVAAADACRHAIQVRPTDERAHLLLAYALGKSGRPAEAIEEWKYLAQNGSKYQKAAIAALQRLGAALPPSLPR